MPLDFPTIVFDPGSSSCKVGFGGDEMPTYISPPIVGYQNYPYGRNQERNIYIGEEAKIKAKECNLLLKYPIERGIISNFEDMEKLCNYIFYDKLKIDPTEYSILLTEPLFSPKKGKEKMGELFFETFNFDSFFVSFQGILSLYSSGRITGLILDIGEFNSFVIPIYERYYDSSSIYKSEISGFQLTNYLQSILKEKHQKIFERDVVENIKEKYINFSDSKEEKNIEYKLPSGDVIELSNDELSLCPELLFKPELNGFSCEGIDKILLKSLRNYNTSDEQEKLLNNVVLSGGCSLIKDFDIRLSSELNKALGESEKAKIYADPNRKFFNWIGGSVFASLNTFSSMKITKNEYKENGNEIIHRKCDYINI